MMKRGFEFDAALCVECNACNAACVLENGFQPGTRSILKWNSEISPLFRVINISLACNHCEKPLCLDGCPAKAYSVESSGVILHHPEKCIGCSYCTWRCPYDAPKMNRAKGVIEKCSFCTERLAENISPACVTSCPTGALKMITEEDLTQNEVAWFPERSIKPSVSLKNVIECKGPLIIPIESADNEPVDVSTVSRLRKEWSLVVFSLLVTGASALLIVPSLGNTSIPSLIPSLMLAVSLMISFRHLGKPSRAYRAVRNIISSPLSREIVLVSILTVMAFVNRIFPGKVHPVITAIAALVTAISVDLVYLATDKSLTLRLHSGQVFFSVLILASWFAPSRTVFLIFSMIAAVSVVIRYRTTGRGDIARSLYYFRALSLPLVFMLLYPENRLSDATAMIIFIAGIIADRALFFDDFNPVNIRESIADHFNNEYEKERDQQRQNAGIS